MGTLITDYKKYITPKTAKLALSKGLYTHEMCYFKVNEDYYVTMPHNGDERLLYKKGDIISKNLHENHFSGSNPNLTLIGPKVTQETLQYILRIHFNIIVLVDYDSIKGSYSYDVYKDNKATFDIGFSTYELALEKGLKQGLKQIKNK